MADGLGVNVTKFDAGTSDANWIDQGLIKSSLKVWSDSFEADGTQGIGDAITVAELPAGAVVHGVSIQFDALGGGSTLEMGDANTSDLYKAALSTASAGSDNGIAADGSQYVIGTNANDERILLTVGGAAVTGTIKSQVYYTN